MKNMKKFNESWFSKKDKSEGTSDITPRGVSRTLIPTQRNTSPGLSEEELEELKRSSDSKKELTKVDPYFMHEISDRLYGPDSEEYIQAIKDLNAQFRPREGRAGNQLYDPSITDEFRRREGEVNKIIKGE